MARYKAQQASARTRSPGRGRGGPERAASKGRGYVDDHDDANSLDGGAFVAELSSRGGSANHRHRSSRGGALQSEVDSELLVEKEQEIHDLRETVELLEQKIAKLEQLLRLKDTKIIKLKEAALR